MNATEPLRQYLADGEVSLALLAALAELIRDRIARSGMWELPPEYLGYPEYHRWSEAFDRDDVSPGPVGDFFLQEIVPERDFLRQTIAAGNSVDALLRQKVQRFLTDRQKACDPIGYRAFMNLVAVLEEMLADGVATAVNRVRGKLRNPTVIRLNAGSSHTPFNESELARAIDADPDWPRVLLRLGKLGKGAQRLLRECLDRLPLQGVSAFSVGDLAAVLKLRAREAHEAWNRPVDAAVALDNQGASDESRTVPLTESYSDLDEYLRLLRQHVPQTIENSGCALKVRHGMRVVFDDWLKYLALGQDHPPLREWSAQLGIPKSSLDGYRQRLRPLMQAVLEQRRAH